MPRANSRKGLDQVLKQLDPTIFKVVPKRNGHREVRRIDPSTGRILAKKQVATTPGGSRSIENEKSDLRRYLGAVIDGRGPAVDPFADVSRPSV